MIDTPTALAALTHAMACIATGMLMAWFGRRRLVDDDRKDTP